MIAGQEAGEILAGVRIRLGPGWKTYWKFPGDAGVPPSFDWTGSQNLASAEVQWPAPKRFVSYGETIIGYEDEVIFPIKIRPRDSKESISLSLSLFYAVCRNVCVPVQIEASASLEPGAVSKQHRKDLDHFLDRVPKEKVEGLTLNSTAFVVKGEKDFLEVSANISDPATPVDIFVEGEGAQSFGAPVLGKVDSRTTTFLLPLHGQKGHAATENELTITMVQGDKAIANQVYLP